MSPSSPSRADEVIHDPTRMCNVQGNMLAHRHVTRHIVWGGRWVTSVTMKYIVEGEVSAHEARLLRTSSP